MVCNIHAHRQPRFIIMLTINCGGVLCTVLSIICVIANTSIDQSLRGILLSYSVANVMGTVMLTYDSFVLICFGDHFLNFVVTITMTLSVTHIMLLMLAEYISLTYISKQRARDYTGLLLISWIISITFGSMNVVTIGNTAKIVFVIIFLFAALSILQSYFVVIKKHQKKKYLLETYKRTFLRQNSHTNKVLKRSWKIKLLAIIIFSYIGCSIPWVVNELWEGFQTDENNPFAHAVALLIYSLNFYFPSGICLYLKYIQRRSTTEWKRKSYRYRDSFM